MLFDTWTNKIAAANAGIALLLQSLRALAASLSLGRSASQQIKRP
jgi:hypothetical protein